MKNTRTKTTAFHVKEKSGLFDFILAKMGGMSKTKVKSLLSHRQVSVNDKTETKYDFPLKENDKVVIGFSKQNTDFHHAKLRIIYEDDYLIAVNKSEGLLAVATDREEETTAFHIVKDYLRKKNPESRLYIVHRIDRETSGVLLFAKTKDIQLALHENWHNDVHKRIYYALVEGVVGKDKDSIVSWLTENSKSKKVHSASHDNGGQKAITHYQVIERYDKFSLLKIELETGRKNQIRVHMQSIGHPVVGDKKYGAQTSLTGRLGLHAAVLVIRHPATKQIVKFESELPFSPHRL
ncbi:MAG: RluA family pseudouridine synthase [Prevotellaceae bacterium]|jgi:23S rRNA pseudouridine1911/1915/1917 synthase|nr:RluA family pseudouridine synthase [Prevotellaceae bacterium]